MFLHGVLRPRSVRALRTAGHLVHLLELVTAGHCFRELVTIVPQHQPDPLRGEVAGGAFDGRERVEQFEVGVISAVCRVEVARQLEPQARLVVALRAPVMITDYKCNGFQLRNTGRSICSRIWVGLT